MWCATRLQPKYPVTFQSRMAKEFNHASTYRIPILGMCFINQGTTGENQHGFVGKFIPVFSLFARMFRNVENINDLKLGF